MPPQRIRALQAQSRKHHYPTHLLDAIDKVNQSQKNLIGKKLAIYFADSQGLKGKTIAILGLAFKPDTDDMREAPSLTLIHDLLAQGVKLRLFDPVAMDNAKSLIDSPSVTWCGSEIDAAAGADAIVLMTEWKQFRFLDFTAILAAMKGHAFFDRETNTTPPIWPRKDSTTSASGDQLPMPNKQMSQKFPRFFSPQRKTKNTKRAKDKRQFNAKTQRNAKKNK